jgi:hypothetical protein
MHDGSGYWKVGSQDVGLVEASFFGSYATQPPLTDALGWQSWDYAVRRLGPKTFLITYVLRWGSRYTSSHHLERSPEGWRAVSPIFRALRPCAGNHRSATMYPSPVILGVRL